MYQLKWWIPVWQISHNTQLKKTRSLHFHSYLCNLGPESPLCQDALSSDHYVSWSLVAASKLRGLGPSALDSLRLPRARRHAQHVEVLEAIARPVDGPSILGWKWMATDLRKYVLHLIFSSLEVAYLVLDRNVYIYIIYILIYMYLDVFEYFIRSIHPDIAIPHFQLNH